MSNLVGGDGRTHIKSKLMRESLQDRGVISQTDSDRDVSIFPDVSLVSIGGQSIFDRGKAAIPPLVEEIVRDAPSTVQAPPGALIKLSDVPMDRGGEVRIRTGIGELDTVHAVVLQRVQSRPLHSRDRLSDRAEPATDHPERTVAR